VFLLVMLVTAQFIGFFYTSTMKVNEFGFSNETGQTVRMDSWIQENWALSDHYLYLRHLYLV